MIGKDQIAEALRYADALSEENPDLPSFWRERGVDVEGLGYVAMQHGLRMVMVMRGMSPNVSHASHVSLSAEEETLMVRFASSFMTGFATYAEVKRLNDQG